jgi:hypothetical protein
MRNKLMLAVGAAAMAAIISSRRAGVTRSSASIDRIQSVSAFPIARFFCGPKPGQ